jgi:hypothetical protein
MFVLTAEEKRVVCFVMLAILIGVAVKQYRHTRPVPHPLPAAENIRQTH